MSPTRTTSSSRRLVLVVVFALTLAAGLTAACDDDGGGDRRDMTFNDFIDQSPPDLFNPGDAPMGGGDGYGYGDTGGTSADLVGDTEPDLPPPPPCDEKTFTYTDPTASTVWVTGSWLADPVTGVWPTTPAEGALELVDDGSGTFSLLTVIDPPGRHQYKFIIDGNTWLNDPAESRQRFDGFSTYNSELVVCDDTGPACTELRFTHVDPQASSVWLSGSWLADPVSGAWPTHPAEGAIALQRDAEGAWTTTTSLPVGSHLYKFIVNGDTWIHQDTNPDRVSDGFGGFNSVVEVCRGEFDACGTLEDFDWRDAVMYFVMVDRFADSDGQADPVANATDGDAATGPSGQYEGGDLGGVTARIPYLADLGVTAIWLSAPYENRDTAGAAIDPGSDPHLYSGYHGYWPSPDNVSYADPANPSPRPRVESRIGTEQDLRDFVGAAHAATTADGHGMKVLFDYVMNHVDIESGLYQAHPDWFARRGDGSFPLCGPENLWDDPYWGLRCAFTSYLPAFEFDNADARAWSVADAVWWATEFGIDGYRLDAIKHVPQQWLLDLRAALDQNIADPAGGRFYLVGETFAYDDPRLIASFIDPETKLDGQFDFPFKARLCEAAFGTNNGGFGDFERWLREENDRAYPAGTIMTTWIGNHDIPRPIHFASREITNCREGSNPGNGWDWRPAQPAGPEAYERLGVAFAVMFSLPGIPLLYYGDEVGLAGGGDPDNRRMMPPEAALNTHQRALRDKVAELARIRAENKALTRGRRVTESVSADTWVFRMTGCGAPDVVVAINRADSARNVTLPPGNYTDLRTGAAASGGSRSLAARDYAILRVE